MAVKLNRVTEEKKILKIISVTDDAIDWANSFASEKLSDGEKKALYYEDHDATQLAFLADAEEPTQFVFRHPHRADTSKALRQAFAAASREKNVEVYDSVWEIAFLGTEEGLSSDLRTEPPRSGGMITQHYKQALHDTGVFQEMVHAYTKAMRTSEKLREDKKK